MSVAQKVDTVRSDMLESLMKGRARMKAKQETLPEGEEKRLAQYYLDCWAALDRATPDDVIETVNEIMCRNDADPKYMLAMLASVRVNS